MRVIRAIGAAEQAVGIALVDHHRADQRQPPSHLDLGKLLRHALAFHQAVVLPPVSAVAGVVLGVDHLEIDATTQPQGIAFDALLDDGRTTDQDRLGQTLVDDDLYRAQYAFILAFGEDDPLGRVFRRLKYRLHQQPGVINELQQPLVIRLEIGDRTGRDPRLHRSPGNSWCDVDD